MTVTLQIACGSLPVWAPFPRSNTYTDRKGIVTNKWLKQHMLFPLLLLAALPSAARPQGTPDKAPVPAQQAGYTSLAYDDEFVGQPQSLFDRWNLGLWYQAALVSPEVSMKAGILNVTARAAPDLRNTFLTSPRSFGFGYFEIRMRWPQNAGNWANFWLVSDLPKQFPYAGPWPPYCEIDVVEAMLPGFQHAVHNWRGRLNENRPAFTMVSVDSTEWHTYGVLRQPGQITFYLDGSPTWSTPSPRVCDEQHLFVVFGTQRRDDNAQSADFDWVRVWQ
jgi:beta-glucanase (GH16 family)